MPHGNQWYWVVGAIVALIVGIAVVSGGSNNDETTSASSNAPAAPTKAARVGATGCTANEALDTFDDLEKASSAVDAIGNPLIVAASGNYAPAIVSLQDARTSLADADIPNCGEVVRREMLAALDAEIDGFTRLSSGGTSDEVATQFELATEHFNRVATAVPQIYR